MKMMTTTSEWMEFINFTSHMLYMFVAFMCGVLIGYLVGLRNGSGGGF
jgi:hypothetical protein